jgi:hypothetical protein
MRATNRVDGDASRLAAALRVAEHAGVRPLALNCLDALAQARAERGDAHAAATLFGAVTAFRETLATPPAPREHARLDRLRARLEQALGAEPFAAAFGAGRARAWPEAVADALRAPAAAPPVGQVVLRREDDVWAITSGGRRVRLRDSKGLQYLATLIAAPGHDHHVLELAGSALDEPAPAALDDAARAAYRHRLAELEEEIDEAERFADPERVARLHGERDALYSELRSAIGLGGRPRAGGSTERARKAVTNRLRDAVARIEREDAELAAHLRASVHTGILCASSERSRGPSGPSRTAPSAARSPRHRAVARRSSRAPRRSSARDSDRRRALLLGVPLSASRMRRGMKAASRDSSRATS